MRDFPLLSYHDMWLRRGKLGVMLRGLDVNGRCITTDVTHSV